MADAINRRMKKRGPMQEQPGPSVPKPIPKPQAVSGVASLGAKPTKAPKPIGAKTKLNLQNAIARKVEKKPKTRSY